MRLHHGGSLRGKSGGEAFRPPRGRLACSEANARRWGHACPPGSSVLRGAGMCRSGRSQGSVPRRRCSWLGWGSSGWRWMLVRGRRRRPGFGSFVRLAVARPVILGPPARTGASRARSLLCRRSVRAVRDGYRRVGGTLAGMRTGTSGGCRSTRNSPHRAGRLPVPVPAAAPSRRADTTPRPSALTLMGFLPFGFIFDAFLPVRDHRWLGSPVFPGRKGLRGICARCGSAGRAVPAPV